MKKFLSAILAIAMLVSVIGAIPVISQAATMPSCNSLKTSSVTTSSVRVDFTIKNPSCLKVKTCGMQIRKKGTSSWSTKSETVTSSYQKKSSIPVWYTVGSGKEFSFTLSAGTTYEYRGFCKYNNKTYYTSTGTFTTAKLPNCNSLKTSSVTTSSVRVDFTIKNPSCLTVKTCGMQIRKKGTSSWSTKSETVTSSYQKKSSIPVWYTVGKGKEFSFTLSAGTTYEYRGFCKYNNKTYYTSTGTFTTPKTTTKTNSSNYSSDYRRWSQNKSSYSWMRSYGCGIVAYSKLIYETGINKSSSFNPDVYYKYCLNKGYVNNGGFTSSNGSNAVIAYAKSLGKTGLSYVGATSSNCNAKVIENAKKGYYSICNTGGHYVMINNAKTKSTGTIYCYDSWNSSTTSIPAAELKLSQAGYNGLTIKTVYTFKYNS